MDSGNRSAKHFREWASPFLFVIDEADVSGAIVTVAGGSAVNLRSFLCERSARNRKSSRCGMRESVQGLNLVFRVSRLVFSSLSGCRFSMLSGDSVAVVGMTISREERAFAAALTALSLAGLGSIIQSGV